MAQSPGTPGSPSRCLRAGQLRGMCPLQTHFVPLPGRTGHERQWYRLYDRETEGCFVPVPSADGDSACQWSLAPGHSGLSWFSTSHRKHPISVPCGPRERFTHGLSWAAVFHLVPLAPWELSCLRNLDLPAGFDRAGRSPGSYGLLIRAVQSGRRTARATPAGAQSVQRRLEVSWGGS